MAASNLDLSTIITDEQNYSPEAKSVFSRFFEDSDSAVQTAAALAAKYATQLQQGLLNAAEYKDLLNDITVIKDVDKVGRTLKDLEDLQTALNTIKTLAEAIPIPV